MRPQREDAETSTESNARLLSRLLSSDVCNEILRYRPIGYMCKKILPWMRLIIWIPRGKELNGWDTKDGNTSNYNLLIENQSPVWIYKVSLEIKSPVAEIISPHRLCTGTKSLPPIKIEPSHLRYNLPMW